MKKKNAFQVFFICIFIIVFLLIVLVSLLKEKVLFNTKAQTQQTETITVPTVPATSSPGVKASSEWISYTSKQYGFSLNYPHDWQLLEQPNVNGIEIQKVDKQGLGFSISIRVLDNPNKLSIKDFAVVQAYPRENGAQDTPQLISVAGVQSYRLVYLPKSLLLDVFMPYKKGVMNIFAGGDIDLDVPKIRSYYDTIVREIINTFRYQQ